MDHYCASPDSGLVLSWIKGLFFVVVNNLCLARVASTTRLLGDIMDHYCASPDSSLVLSWIKGPFFVVVNNLCLASVLDDAAVGRYHGPLLCQSGLWLGFVLDHLCLA